MSTCKVDVIKRITLELNEEELLILHRAVLRMTTFKGKIPSLSLVDASLLRGIEEELAQGKKALKGEMRS